MIQTKEEREKRTKFMEEAVGTMGIEGVNEMEKLKLVAAVNTLVRLLIKKKVISDEEFKKTMMEMVNEILRMNKEVRDKVKTKKDDPNYIG